MKYSSTPYEKSEKKIPGNSSNFSNSNTSKSSFGIESPVSSMSHGSEAVSAEVFAVKALQTSLVHLVNLALKVPGKK